MIYRSGRPLAGGNLDGEGGNGTFGGIILPFLTCSRHHLETLKSNLKYARPPNSAGTLKIVVFKNVGSRATDSTFRLCNGMCNSMAAGVRGATSQTERSTGSARVFGLYQSPR